MLIVMARETKTRTQPADADRDERHTAECEECPHDAGVYYVASYVTLTTVRTTTPDPVALAAAVKSATNDATAVLMPVPGRSWCGKKAAAWSANDISATQLALDTVAAFDYAVFDLDQKVMKAVLSALWECIPAPTMTKAQARTRAIAIYQTL